MTDVGPRWPAYTRAATMAAERARTVYPAGIRPLVWVMSQDAWLCLEAEMRALGLVKAADSREVEGWHVTIDDAAPAGTMRLVDIIPDTLDQLR